MGLFVAGTRDAMGSGKLQNRNLLARSIIDNRL